MTKARPEKSSSSSAFVATVVPWTTSPVPAFSTARMKATDGSPGVEGTFVADDGSVVVHGDHVGERPTGVDADPDRHAWTSSKICSGEIGIRSIGTPSASETALAIAPATGIVPASPTPLTPSTLLGDGVSVWNSAGSGSSVA